MATKNKSMPWKAPKKTRVPNYRGIDEMELWCLDNGYECRQKEKWLRDCEKIPDLRSEPPRFTYIKGSNRVLMPNHECPWWTYQRMEGTSVTFVDFDLNWPVAKIAAFILAD